MSKPKLAVIGASHFQLPLIEKARDKGCEVHAFAWECGDVGEAAADVFPPVSIVDVDRIVGECGRVGVDGVCTIASDLATVAVCHVADALGLVGNSLECMHASTDKGAMRRAFDAGGDPSPRSLTIGLMEDDATPGRAPVDAPVDLMLAKDDLDRLDPLEHGLWYPLIVKPADRSGSRGVTKLEAPDVPVTVGGALRDALEQGFAKRAVVEEFVEGDEFSVEGASWEGEHRILAITRKGTTGAPHFIETAHLQPAGLAVGMVARIESVVAHALDTLGVRYGASHSELKVSPDGAVRLIEIGARMGGDCIGSHLVPLSTGIDYVGAVIDTALGREPDLTPVSTPVAAAVRFLFDDADRRVLERVRHERPDLIRYVHMTADADATGQVVSDSSTRLGHFVIASPAVAELMPYLPAELVAALDVCDVQAAVDAAGGA